MHVANYWTAPTSEPPSFCPSSSDPSSPNASGRSVCCGKPKFNITATIPEIKTTLNRRLSVVTEKNSATDPRTRSAQDDGDWIKESLQTSTRILDTIEEPCEYVWNEQVSNTKGQSSSEHKSVSPSKIYQRKNSDTWDLDVQRWCQSSNKIQDILTQTDANRNVVTPPMTGFGTEKRHISKTNGSWTMKHHSLARKTPEIFPRTPNKMRKTQHHLPAERLAQRVMAMTPLFYTTFRRDNYTIAQLTHLCKDWQWGNGEQCWDETSKPITLCPQSRWDRQNLAKTYQNTALHTGVKIDSTNIDAR